MSDSTKATKKPPPYVETACGVAWDSDLPLHHCNETKGHDAIGTPHRCVCGATIA